MNTRDFSVRIRTGNAAFSGGNRDAEIARILRAVADWLERGGIDTIPVRDINGNTVGEAGDVGE